jgi:putative sigma-54 modulation protein
LKQGTKDGIESELKRIEKMLPENASFDVTLTKKKDGYQCDITVKHIGSFIRGEARAERIEAAVDAAVDDLKRKLRKLKTFFVDKKRKGGIDEIATAMDDLSQDVTMDNFDEVYYESVDINRQKTVSLHMMTDDEAIVQMEMLGHSFFVYLGIDGETKIIYKRKKGYGVLICE